MDPLAPLTPLFRLVFYLAIGVFAIRIVAFLFRTAWFKGWLGERQVNLALRANLDRRQYHIVNNVTLPTDDGSTQIDHVVVSVYGLFVIETKNMTGWIFGGERDKIWTQKRFKQTFKFQNPLRQNFKHTQTLAKLLDLPPPPSDFHRRLHRRRPIQDAHAVQRDAGPAIHPVHQNVYDAGLDSRTGV